MLIPEFFLCDSVILSALGAYGFSLIRLGMQCRQRVSPPILGESKKHQFTIIYQRGHE